MNKIFKYKTNDEVWVIWQNRPQQMLIKECLLSIGVKIAKIQGGGFIEGETKIGYTVYSKCTLFKDHPYIDEKDIFPTKEALIESL